MTYGNLYCSQKIHFDINYSEAAISYNDDCKQFGIVSISNDTNVLSE